jgi:hypothetical protein
VKGAPSPQSDTVAPTPPLLSCRTPSSLAMLDDLHVFDPATMTWTSLSAADAARRPSARFIHGFTSAGGRLYVHGGISVKGGRRL